MKVNNRKNCKGYILLCFDGIPKHCGECPLYKETYYEDDEPMWGDGIIHYCPFGGDTFGCLVERPANCPIVTPENKSQKLI